MENLLTTNIANKLLENFEKKNGFTMEEREFLVSSLVKVHLENNNIEHWQRLKKNGIFTQSIRNTRKPNSKKKNNLIVFLNIKNSKPIFYR